MPRFEWKIDATAILTVLVVAGGIAVGWGVQNSRLSAVEEQLRQVSASSQQLTVAVTRLQTQIEERDRREDRRR